LRHKLESLFGRKDPRTIDFAWPNLKSEDTFIRYAARIAIEWQDVPLWEHRALAETNVNAASAPCWLWLAAAAREHSAICSWLEEISF